MGMRCGICHLPTFVGRDQMPRLAGQREDYMLYTMRAMKANQVVGRDPNKVRHELDGLVKAEMLNVEVASGQRIYRLTTDTNVRQLIREFVVACHNREFRARAINHVIHGMEH